MNLNLNKSLIDNCNNNSQFNSGNVLANEAVRMLSRFDDFLKLEGLTDEQCELIQERQIKFKELIEEAYNNMLGNRAKFVPWNVSGRANYPVERMRKIGDRNLEKGIEWHDKIDRFLENTSKMLKGLTPLEDVLENYSKGKWKYGEVISSDDPHVVEKLNAKLMYLEKRQEKMKSENRLARKEKRDRLYMPYELTNNLASIKATRKRIEKISSTQEMEGFKFEGGEVVANYEINRLQILFDEKPDEKMRIELKSNAFRWAPSQHAWQRQLTKNALYAAKRIFIKEEK